MQASLAHATFPKARNRKEKLAIALAHLECGGIKGRLAYPATFEACMGFGIIFKPLFYWSWAGLTLFIAFVFTIVITLLRGFEAIFGLIPRVAHMLLDLGPISFALIALMLGFAGGYLSQTQGP